MFFKKQNTELEKLKKKYHEIQEKELLQSIELRELKDKEKELTFLQESLKQYNIMGFEKNKLGNKYYVCLFAEESSFALYLKKPFTRRHTVPRLYGKIYTRRYMDFMDTCIIQDIFAEDEDEGNGTILLKYAKKYLKSIGVRRIYGDLSFVDVDHFDKLEKFYENNGFKVTFNEERTSGSIEIII